jgi:hypothetical protein
MTGRQWQLAMTCWCDTGLATGLVYSKAQQAAGSTGQQKQVAAVSYGLVVLKRAGDGDAHQLFSCSSLEQESCKGSVFNNNNNTRAMRMSAECLQVQDGPSQCASCSFCVTNSLQRQALAMNSYV